MLSKMAKPMEEWAKTPGVIAVVNGGFFTGNTPLSLVAREGRLQAHNISAVTRAGRSYPVLRSAFWVDSKGNAQVGWIYHHAGEGQPRSYPQPLPYSSPAEVPLQAPKINSGIALKMDWGIGGGPRLLREGKASLTYQEEIFWGSGMRLDDKRPRTAICSANKQRIILYVTPSARLDELPDRLLELGCRDAINLDGGGSSSLYVNGESIHDQGRPVPAVIAVVLQH
ncbi:hypothetical protein Maes01_01808 [Microbulbifer aestuariivivens]|uniref:Phosphodiester glycosidase domain-containing protein n=2 Tax=Microbulbifer aestuariivivens TaxID=1908308 RepID=A0ABP9WPX3_9GAMM